MAVGVHSEFICGAGVKAGLWQETSLIVTVGIQTQFNSATEAKVKTILVTCPPPSFPSPAVFSRSVDPSGKHDRGFGRSRNSAASECKQMAYLFKARPDVSRSELLDTGASRGRVFGCLDVTLNLPCMKI